MRLTTRTKKIPTRRPRDAAIKLKFGAGHSTFFILGRERKDKVRKEEEVEGRKEKKDNT